jgi:MFS family permease
MKKLIAINFLNQFLEGAIIVVLPLLLLERKIEIYKIGIIFSISPLVVAILRLVFAALADQVGTKIFFLINSFTNSISKFIYLLARSPILFGLGKITEGIMNSSFWAVVRTETYLQSKKGKEEKAAALLSGIRRIGAAFGTIFAGFLLVRFSFNSVLFLIFLISLFLFIPSLLLKTKKGKISLDYTFSLLDLRKKSLKFWFVSIAMAFWGMTMFSLSSFFPIFMKTKISLSPQKIGQLFSLFYFSSAFLTFLGLRFKISFFQIIFLQLLFFLPALLFIPFSSPVSFPFLFLILATGAGFSYIIFEKIIADVTKGLPSTSTDIGILHIPQRIFEFLAGFSGGFLIEKFGFVSIFSICGFSFFLFSISSLLLLKR